METSHIDSAFLRLAVEHTLDYIMLLDQKGIIQYLNRAPIGIDRQSMIGVDWFSLICHEQRPELQKIFASVMRDGKSGNFEFLSRGDFAAPVWYSTCLTPLSKDEKIIGALLISRDLTEKKLSEDQLLEADRLASLGILVAGVAHEINNPLASVLISLEFMIDQCNRLESIPVKHLSKLKETFSAAERIGKIVQDLKTFSFKDDDSRALVSVADVLDSTLRIARHEIQNRAQLLKNYQKVPQVYANDGRLGQVFLNLIINAAHSIPEGQPDKNTIEISIYLKSHKVITSIKDTGCGIPKENSKKVFTPFFTTKPKGIGTGLGLSICKRIIKSIGGEISFTSSKENGTEFLVALPAVGMGDTIVSENKNDSEEVVQARILIVDDEENFSRVLEEVLSDDNEVTTVESAQEALDLLKAGERYNVIISDLMMPHMTGMEMYEIIKKMDPVQAKRMVFMTGGAFTPAMRSFLDSIENRIIEKPFKLKELRQFLNSLSYK